MFVMFTFGFLAVEIQQKVLTLCIFGSTYRERQNLAKINRRTEKKLKEFALSIEDERRNAEQYKEQVCHDESEGN